VDGSASTDDVRLNGEESSTLEHGAQLLVRVALEIAKVNPR
jgi:hypothetical protein